MRTYEIQLMGKPSVFVRAKNRDAIDALLDLTADISNIECCEFTTGKMNGEPDFIIITPGDG